MVEASRILLRDAAVLDPEAGQLVEGQAVLVEGERIVEVGPEATLRPGDATVLDAGGMTVMPGLIDAHVHVTAASANLAELDEWTPTYLTARAAGILRGMLDRGFTTRAEVRPRIRLRRRRVGHAFLLLPVIFRSCLGGQRLPRTAGRVL